MTRFTGELPAEVQRHISENARISTSDYTASLELAARDIAQQETPETTTLMMIEAINKKVQHLTQRCLKASRSLKSQTSL